MRKTSWLTLALLLSGTIAMAQLKSPDQFLPHRLGETFTPHDMLVDYMEHVAANSSIVRLTRYGLTNQKRPLLLLAISSPENMARLDAIRQNNLRRAGLLDGKPDPSLDVAIVWLSFSVHGNEAAGSEASMQVVYDLVNPANTQSAGWLKNTVVLIDPSLNPDGYSRYSHWYRNVANLKPDPNPRAREHREPWPGGRVNHYMFDLNRDWAWQTQVESQQRIKIYYDWMPHVHADIHEQFYNNPYYFAPAAQPYHTFITQWQRDFQTQIGKNHARHFDSNGWLYFTREVFDLFYPSYGDTYPTYNGSIGMTYEQGGHSRAGRAIVMHNADTLTLKDRVTHHHSTALSTVEVSSQNAAQLVKNFDDYFTKSRNNPPGIYKTYIIKGSNPRGKLLGLCELLKKNGITYGKAETPVSVKAYDYQTGKETTVKIEANDLVISAYQPRAILTQVLLDPNSELVDSNTYDITSWSLPYAHGVESYATSQRINVKAGYDPAAPAALVAGSKPYAYLATWNAMNNARFLSEVLQGGVVVRFASTGFRLEGKAYPAGTLVITRADNRKNEQFDEVVQRAARSHQQEITAVSTGFADSGRDLGSDAMTLVNTPKIAVLSGENTFDNEFGQVWYYFEQDLRYPLSIFDAGELSGLNLNDFNVLVMPEGQYNLDDATLDKLNTWINGGGRLIAVGYAVSSLEDKKGFSLTTYATEDAKTSASKARDEDMLARRLMRHEDHSRDWISGSNPGSVFKLRLDNSHPLGYGLPDYYFSLKTNSLHYQHLKGVSNVGTTGEDLMISGFIGSKARAEQKNTTVFGVQQKGQGAVIYMVDNPLFRGFWENGKLLFSNAVFFAGR
ncbi:MAG: zinc carboxypeptidase [Saprospiraceae bacterium]|nr:zinc carboxypeptidase [Saprospiraceae bacterium]